jgi:predicted P-loop ATPase
MNAYALQYDFGVKPQIALRQPTCIAPPKPINVPAHTRRLRGVSFSAEDVHAALKRVMGMDQNFDLDGGKPLHTQSNIRLALRRLRVFCYHDAFAQQAHLLHFGKLRKFMPLDDAAERELRLAIDERFQFLPQREFFRDVVLNEAQKNSFHPVCEYLDELSWDGTPRIDTWLITHAGAADSEYVRHVSRLVLIAAVRRVRQPGTKFDELLVLESDQGKGKSSGLEALCPRRSWYSDSVPLNAHQKEVIEQTAGKWLVEIAELSGMSGAKVEQLKAMLSRQVDSSRMAYGHHRLEVTRQWIAIGTTNDSEYLRDSTGNRRFWPVAITHFDVAGIRATRDQLWAEAAEREAAGESIRLPERLWAEAAREQEQRFVVDPFEDELRHLLSLTVPPKDRISRRDVYALLGLDPRVRDKSVSMRVNAAMVRLGWRKMTVSARGTVEPGYGRDTP